VHGYGISQRIRQISKEVLQVQQGSLYPALHRLEKRGWLAAEWGESEKGRQAKFYKLSAKGRKQLKAKNRTGIAWPAPCQYSSNRSIGVIHVLVEILTSQARFRRAK